MHEKNPIKETYTYGKRPTFYSSHLQYAKLVKRALLSAMLWPALNSALHYVGLVWWNVGLF